MIIMVILCLKSSPKRMQLDRRKRNGNTLLRAINSCQNKSFSSVFVETLDLEDSALVIYYDIFNLNHTYNLAQKVDFVKFFFNYFNFFYFVVSRCGSTSCAIRAWAVCPKLLMFSYLEERIGDLHFTLRFLAISIAFA